MSLNKTVKDVMTNDFIIINGLATVENAIEIAREKKVKMLIIDKRNESDEFGIVMMSDIAKQILSKNRAPERVNLYEIMTKPALSVSSTMNVKYCGRFFERFGISRAPVIEEGKVLGVVSFDSIVLG